MIAIKVSFIKVWANIEGQGKLEMTKLRTKDALSGKLKLVVIIKKVRGNKIQWYREAVR